MVPAGIGERNQLSKRLEGLALLGGRLGDDGSSGGLRLGSGSGRRRRRSLRFRLRLGVEGADKELIMVLLENALVVVLPELLGCILAGYALQDFLAAWTEICASAITLWEGLEEEHWGGIEMANSPG